MAMRNPGARRRRFSPGAEGLESRQLLSSLSTQPSAKVSGTDIDGDRWSLTLYGPGTMNVTDSSGYAFTKDYKNVPDLINTITIGGSISPQTRLVGKVTKGPNGDGRVFFQNLHVTPTGQLAKLDPLDTSNNKQAQNGIAAIDMPQFYLGHTDTTKPVGSSNLHSGFLNAGEITIPGGINTLRFGGVDTTYTPPGGTPLNTDGQNDEFVVNLGLPVAYGTSIIVNRVVTDAQAATTSTGTATQKSVTFVTTGRVNLFQANEIDGNTSSPSLIPSQFQTSTASNMPGGTYVISRGGTVTGAIGYVRVGGNATNFTTFALANDLAAAAIDSDVSDPKISNFYVGQETNNVILVAPGGSRDVYFGRGMDNVQINTLLIQNLFANRGAVSSNVIASRSISNAAFGGDVADTNIQAGYAQSLASDANIPSAGFSAGAGVFNGVKLPTIASRVMNAAGTLVPLAQNGGNIQIRIAGNLTNSVVSASVDPDPSGLVEPGAFSNVTTPRFPFGTPDNLVLPRGTITAKVEGNVDNSTNPLVSPTAPANKAFFAKSVKYTHGPVTPPNVVEPPFAPTQYHKGQKFLYGLFTQDHPRRKRK
jgi:hypothetical protein